ncbi:unnamed protein product [Amoebophrya sp. A120]|nr:unnamed protein product [Amoebophrya sp. A120]|eukprot:GSA120T00002412001.1
MAEGGTLVEAGSLADMPEAERREEFVVKFPSGEEKPMSWDEALKSQEAGLPVYKKVAKRGRGRPPKIRSDAKADGEVAKHRKSSQPPGGQAGGSSSSSARLPDLKNVDDARPAKKRKNREGAEGDDDNDDEESEAPPPPVVQTKIEVTGFLGTSSLALVTQKQGGQSQALQALDIYSGTAARTELDFRQKIEQERRKNALGGGRWPTPHTRADWEDQQAVLREKHAEELERKRMRSLWNKYYKRPAWYIRRWLRVKAKQKQKHILSEGDDDAEDPDSDIREDENAAEGRSKRRRDRSESPLKDDMRGAAGIRQPYVSKYYADRLLQANLEKYNKKPTNVRLPPKGEPVVFEPRSAARAREMASWRKKKPRLRPQLRWEVVSRHMDRTGEVCDYCPPIIALEKQEPIVLPPLEDLEPMDRVIEIGDPFFAARLVTLVQEKGHAATGDAGTTSKIVDQADTTKKTLRFGYVCRLLQCRKTLAKLYLVHWLPNKHEGVPGKYEVHLQSRVIMFLRAHDPDRILEKI